MKLLLIIFEFIVSFSLVFAILLHSPKGEGLAGIGGQARLFNASKGLESGLNRVTTVLAVLFMVIAMVLVVV